MKKIILLPVLFLMIIQIQSVLAQCNAPIINTFSPNTGFIGSTVTVTGANFDANPANNQVFFGATKADVLTSSFGVMTVRVPVGATLAPICVKNGCNKIAYSATAFNGIFCPTPINASTYSQNNFSMPAYGAYNMLSQDMDLDGKPDVISGGTGGITIAKNNSTPGNLNFTRFDIARATQGIAVADFDGDGKRDILVSNNVMYVVKNNSVPGTLSFAAAVAFSGGIGAYQCAAGDFNGDGKIDVVTGGGGNVYTFINTSTGPGVISFTQSTVVNVVHACTGLQVADVDGDGKTDILGSQGNGNRAVSIRNTTANAAGTTTFEAPEYWSSNGQYPYRCMIADFDKDGRIDLTTCNYNGATNTAIFRNTSTFGDISFAPSVNLVSPQNNYRIGVGDANGDGFPDIVTKSLGVNVFSVYPNISTGAGNVAFSSRFDYSSSAMAEVSGIVIADLDGDFVPDIATSGISSNVIRFHRNTSSQVDNTPPTAVCKNITVALSPSGTVNVTANMIDNGSGDACGVGAIAINGSASIDFTCANIGQNTVTLAVTDRAGNVSTCTAVVTVAPAAIIVAGQTTVCQGQTVPMTANLGDSYQWFNNGIAIDGATAQSYVATVSGNYSVAVTNAGGCSGTSSQVAIVVNLNPTVATTPANTAYLCPNSLTIAATQSSTYQWYFNNAMINGATGQNFNATVAGTYSVRVIDLFGCSANSSPLVVSNGGPEVDVLGNGVSIVDGDNSPSTVDATDFGLTYPSVSTSKVYTIVNSGTNNLDVSAISVSGVNAANFTVNGITLPAVVNPGSSLAFTVSFTGAAITVYNAKLNIESNDCNESVYDFAVKSEISCAIPTFAVCPSDVAGTTSGANCSGVVSYQEVVTGVPAPSLSYAISGATTAAGSGNGSNELFNLGTSTVTLTATSSCGTAICSFNVVMSDVTAPVAIAQDVTVQLDALGNGSITASHVDNGSNDPCGVTLSVSPNTFDCSNVGSNAVVLTVTDVNGNVSTANANVTVVDAIPAVVLTKNATVYLDVNGSGSISVADVDNGSSDACGLSLVVSPSDFTCVNVGVNNVVTLTATDANGNVSSNTAIVTVLDQAAPNVATQNISIDLDATGNASIVAAQIENGSTDACGISTFTLDNYSFNCSNVGVNNVVTLTVTDIHGNVSSNTAIVAVNDVTAPVVLTQNIAVQVGVNGSASITASQINNGSTDACGIATMTVFPSTFYCENVGENTVTLTVTDIHGNVSTATAIVTVQDLTVPVVITQTTTVYLNVKGEGRITPRDVNYGSYDVCGISTLTLSSSTFNCSNVGENTITLTATDVNGNVSSNTAVVTVVDAIAPFVYTKNLNIDLDASGNASITPAQINNNSFDACGIATVTLNNSSFNCGNVGENTVILTVTDVHGNVASAPATVIVNDVTAPIAICQNVTVTLANGTATVSAAQVNNGSTDACGIASMTVSPSTFTCGNIGDNSVLLTVTDVNGNASTCSANVTVVGVVPTCTIALSKSDNTYTGGVMTNLYLGYGSSTLTLTSTANGAGPFTYAWSGQGLTTTSGNVTVFAPTVGGNYTLTCTATNSFGCETTCSVVICVKDIRVPNQVGKVYLCHVPKGNPTNSQTLSISVNAVPAHLTGHEGDQLGACGMSCGVNRSKTDVSGDMYSSMTAKGDVDLIVYPNPSNGTFNFTIESESTEGVSIKIYDLAGSVVYNRTNLTANEVITIGNEFSAGLFMAAVTQGEFTKVVKLTKVH